MDFLTDWLYNKKMSDINDNLHIRQVILVIDAAIYQEKKRDAATNWTGREKQDVCALEKGDNGRSLII